MVCILDAINNHHVSMGFPKIPTSLVYLFEELHLAHCSKEEKQMAVIVGWPPLWADYAQLEVEAHARSWKNSWG